jgi:hypothetical protein
LIHNETTFDQLAQAMHEAGLTVKSMGGKGIPPFQIPQAAAGDEVGERWTALKFVPPEIRHGPGEGGLSNSSSLSASS